MNNRFGNEPSRFITLDIARGIAALSVVLWHWQHFWYGATGRPPDFSRVVQPLYGDLRFAYEFGWIGVDFFFMLSGFIFFWKYPDVIRESRIGAWSFFVLRFSRLYPLHLITLACVAVLQVLAARRLGHSFVYPHNDWDRFLLNLFLAANWGVEWGWSFNAPNWSVSVEILLYAAFFILARFGLTRWWQLVMLALFGLAVKQIWIDTIGRGIWCFFIGGALLHLVQTVRGTRAAGTILLAALGSASLGAVAAVWNLDGRIAHATAFITADPVLASYLLYTTLLFPSIVVVLSLGNDMMGTGLKRLAFLGDISYSSYLIHFPLQIAFALTVSVVYGGYSPVPFEAPAMLLLYAACLIGLSLLSYHRVEMPAQNYLRFHMLSKRRVAAS